MRGWLKGVLGAAVASVACVAGLIGWAEHNDEAQRQERKRVTATVTFDQQGCPRDQPMNVDLFNGAERVLRDASLRPHAFEKGRSTDLFGAGAEFAWDTILEPGRHAKHCFALPSWDDPQTGGSITLSVEVETASFYAENEAPPPH